MDLIDMARANERAFTAEARIIDQRRQYHEARTIDHLERKLRAAKQRLGVITTAPQAG